jgi:alanyl-tRNA synthetase
MKRKELIKEYINFFVNNKKFPHKEIPNSSLIPENDPTALFTSAGMHPLVPYLLGQKNPLGKRIVNIQKCIRTTDIEEVGDETHHTFFEMLGNWSLGDYWKKESISMSFEFLTKILKIPKEKIAVSVFKGNEKVPRDKESAKIWKELGISPKRIIFLPDSENWWGPTSKKGPCGPDTEIFYWISKKSNPPEKFDPNNKNWIEIWNNVLMEYNKNDEGKYIKAKQKNIDTGMGLERMITLLNNLEDDYLTELFLPTIKKIEELSNKKYGINNEETKIMRIIADHIKSSVFIIAEGIFPSNIERGYVLRRLIRRAIIYGKKINIKNFLEEIAKSIFEIYPDYTRIQKNKENILNVLKKEEEKFEKTLEKGINQFNKISKQKKEINGKDSFLLFQSYGFPIEMTQEIAKEKKIKINKEDFFKELEKHKNLSRKITKGKFKSGLSDDSISTTRLHTTTHILFSALKKVLKNNDIIQKGANINPERLRFDFSFNRKLTEAEIKEIENYVNKKIKEGHKVIKNCMTLNEAKKSGASGNFNEKYGEKVFVYTIGDFSKEICSGPHVKNTNEIMNLNENFKIIQQKSVGEGIRRIKAVIK